MPWKGEDEVTVTANRLAKELISSWYGHYLNKCLSHKNKADQWNFHTYFFGLIVYLFQNES